MPRVSEGVQDVGPLQHSDVPPAAVDFHVSSIVQALLQQPAIAEAATRAAAAGAASNSESALQRAMWRFRSSTNRKQRLQVGSHSCCMLVHSQDGSHGV